MRRLFFAVSAAVAAAPALACPVSDLGALYRETLTDLTAVEVDVSENRPRKQGTWRVYSRADGSTHSIERTDTDSVSRETVRASFIDARTFIVVAKHLRWGNPPGEPQPRWGTRGGSIAFLFCDADGRIVDLKGGTHDETWETRARDTRAVFDAAEVAPYLAKVNR